MSKRAWAHIWGVLLTGALLGGLSLRGLEPSTLDWRTFAILTVLATLAQLFKAQAPSHQLYHATLVFLFAGILLLHPFLFVLLVFVSHVVEWAKERLLDSPHLRDWYLQPFNIATHIIAGSAAGWVYTALSPDMFHVASSVMASIAAVSTYVAVNHLLVGVALLLARGVPLLESGVLDVENLVTDFIMLCLGVVVGVLWSLDPWLILLALSPLVLIYRALTIPQLKQEARIDSKTGLWNARHFAELYANELARARRFERPLALIMADLDLLRNINNTYGHLAGDVVLAGIGGIIRETIRAYDIAGRFGGEEFAIALPETELMEARSIAERLRRAVETAKFEVNTSPTPIQATMSLGVACFPVDAIEADDLIHEADVAVYQAKLRGRNRVVAASEVPHFIKLEQAPEDRLASPYAAASTARPNVVRAHASPRPMENNEPAGSTTPGAAAPGAPVEDTGQVSAPGKLPRVWLRPFVLAVIVTGAVATVVGVARHPHPDLVAIGLLSTLAVVAELLQLDLYGEGTVSVSVAVAFSAGLIAGVPGVACVSVGIVLVHYVRRRPTVYQTVFNWATHVLAGTAPATVTHVLNVPLQEPTLVLILVVNAAALVYYAIDTGLVATAIGLSENTSPAMTWHTQFRWLGYHYMVLCIMGLFLGIAYALLGSLGVFVFALPVFMMRFAQKQYVDRTEDSVRELKRMNWELTHANQEIVAASQAIQQLNDELFLTLAKIIDARDPYVSGHAATVAEYATAIALELELPPERVEQVRQAAFLHDIGKIGISEQILHKPGRLTDEEYEHVKTHAALGAELLETSQSLRHLAPFVRHHHERWDGRGYPDGLRGEEIPLEARILAVCDAVEAMASDRPYHRAMSLEEIVAEIRRCAGTQFNPTVAQAFIRMVERDGDRLIKNSAQEVLQRNTGSGDPRFAGNGWAGLEESEALLHTAEVPG